MVGHSSWKDWAGNKLPDQLYWDICDAFNALKLTNQLPENVDYNICRHVRNGKWVVVMWRNEQLGLAAIPATAYPIADILADGQKAQRVLRYTLKGSDKEFGTAGRKS